MRADRAREGVVFLAAEKEERLRIGSYTRVDGDRFSVKSPAIKVECSYSRTKHYEVLNALETGLAYPSEETYRPILHNSDAGLIKWQSLQRSAAGS